MTDSKCDKIVDLIKKTFNLKNLKIGQFASVIGKVSVTIPANRWDFLCKTNRNMIFEKNGAFWGFEMAIKKLAWHISPS